MQIPAVNPSTGEVIAKIGINNDTLTYNYDIDDIVAAQVLWRNVPTPERS